MRLRLATLFAAALWAAGCATTQTPATPKGPPPAPPLSAEASAFFAQAQGPGVRGALVVDLDALESLGLLGKGQVVRPLADLAAFALPHLAAEEEGPQGALLARGAVVASVLRHWASWPSVRRFGVVVRSTPGPEGAGLPGVHDAVAALAVHEASPDNAQLLVGLAALGRAVTEELSREGAQVRLVLQGSDLCLEGAELESPFCLRPRPGLMLMGTPEALARLQSSPAAAPASETAAGVASPAPLLLGLRVDMGPQGRASLAMTGQDAVALAVRVEGTSPRAVASLDGMVAKFLSDYDAHEARKRERIASALAEVKATLARDASAPAELKQAASTLTVQQVLDEGGHWAALRQSLKTQAAQDSYTLSLVVPEGLVRQVAAQLEGGGATTASMLGVMAAVAVPNFIKFQSRAKQSEVKSNLRAAYIAQSAYAADKSRWGRTFRDIGFQPEPGARYTYCMGNECLPCTREGCAPAQPVEPCRGIAKVGAKLADGFTVCAWGNLDSDEDLDVWAIDEEGEPQQLSADE